MKYLNYETKRGRQNKEDSELLSDLKIRALSDYQIFEYMVNMIKENPEITESDFSLKFESHPHSIRGILSGYTDGHWYHAGNKLYEKYGILIIQRYFNPIPVSSIISWMTAARRKILMIHTAI